MLAVGSDFLISNFFPLTSPIQNPNFQLGYGQYDPRHYIVNQNILDGNFFSSKANIIPFYTFMEK